MEEIFLTKHHDKEFEDSLTFYYEHCVFTEPLLIAWNFSKFVDDLLNGYLKMSNHEDQVNYTIGIIRKCSSLNNEDFENLVWKLIWSLKEMDDSYADLLEVAFHHRNKI